MLKTAAALLLALAAASAVLAVFGADGALALMRKPVPVAFMAILAGLLAVLAAWRLPGIVRRPSVPLHLGLALVLGGWAYNEFKGDEDGYLRLRGGQVGRVAEAFNFSLSEFRIDRWPDTGTVRQYTSFGSVEGKPVEISVNHPLVRDGWWVYQSSYEELQNPHTGKPLYFTILMCVKDVGLPAVATGGVLLLLGALWLAVTALHRRIPAYGSVSLPPVQIRAMYALAFVGAVAMLVHRGISTGHPPMQNMYGFLMCMAAFVPVLTFVSAKVDGQNTLLADTALMALLLVPVCFVMDGTPKRLMPALQSPLFVPHVGAYVAGYVLLVRAALGAGTRLVGIGFFMLTLGLVLGAAWGKVCWGRWWQFDPKEMWSLATWFVYAAYFHVRPHLSVRGERVFLALGAVMIALTLTWINMSRLFSGMHSYA